MGDLAYILQRRLGKVQQVFSNSRSCDVLIKTVKNTVIFFIGSAICNKVSHHNKVTHRLLCTVLLSLPIS